MLTKLVVTCYLILNLSQAATIIPVSDGKTVFKIEQEGPTRLGGIVLCGDIVAQPIIADEGEFVRIFLPGFHISNEIGAPEYLNYTNLLKFLKIRYPG